MDTAHVFVDASLSRESLYVAMTRGREATTAHVVTGPSPARGQEPMAQADPLAVMAEVMDRTESAWTATEVMREAQAYATDSGHLLTMYSAATRPEAYAVIDANCRPACRARSLAGTGTGLRNGLRRPGQHVAVALGGEVWRRISSPASGSPAARLEGAWPDVADATGRLVCGARDGVLAGSGAGPVVVPAP